MYERLITGYSGDFGLLEYKQNDTV